MMSRKDYWVKSIGISITQVLFLIVSFIISSIAGSVMVVMTLGLLSLVSAISVLVITIMWQIQRFHDVGLGGQFLLISFIPVIGSIIVFIILLLPSNKFDYYQPEVRRAPKRTNSPRDVEVQPKRKSATVERMQL